MEALQDSSKPGSAVLELEVAGPSTPLNSMGTMCCSCGCNGLHQPRFVKKISTIVHLTASFPSLAIS
jgi:hypothetical protein